MDPEAFPHSAEPREAWASQFVRNLLTRLRMSEHTFMIVLAIVVGTLGGLGAVGFRLLIQALQELWWGTGPYTLDLVRSHTWWWILLAPALGGLIVGPLTHFLAREAKGHGVPEVMEAVALNSGLIRGRVVLVKSLASALTIGSGGSVGREGPIVQIGSAMGSVIGQLLRVSGRRLRTLVGCGAAAGIAATFNAPVAGAIFAVEIILGDFAVGQFSPIVISSVMATVISRALLGDVPAFEVPSYGLQSPWELVFYLALGLLAAVVAWVFIKTLYGVEDLFDRLPLPPWARTPLGMLLIGALGISFPQIFGVGYEAINEALEGRMVLAMLVGLLLVKILATSVTIGAGGSGGIFAPSLFLGAMTGGLLGTLVKLLFPAITADPGAYALVGMGAVVAGATHAPLTAILIIFELTSGYQIIVPLMASCTIATLVSSWLSHENIYTLKLSRRGVDLFSGRELNVLRTLKVHQVMTEEAKTVSPETHLGQLVEEITRSPQAFFYVVENGERLRGVIGFDELRQALLEADSLRDLVVADELARTDVPVVTPDQDLDTVMRIFGGKNREELPVVDGLQTRRLRGTVNRGHLLEAYNRELMKRDMVASLASGMATTGSDQIALGDGHWMREMSVPGSFVDRTLRELDVRGRWGVQIVLVRRPAQIRDSEAIELVPGPQTRLRLADQIVVVGPQDALDRLEGA